MTLKEAYELQRSELISLRAKVARLEKQVTGLFPVEEKGALERRMPCPCIKIFDWSH